MSLSYKFNAQEPPAEVKGATYYDTDGHVRNLYFVPAEDDEMFLNYAYLISGSLSREKNRITLAFTTHVVTLKGQNLRALFNGIFVQRLQRITTIEERYAATEEAESFVTQIAVETL